MDGGLRFDWDVHNTDHLAQRDVRPEEAEQVLSGDGLFGFFDALRADFRVVAGGGQEHDREHAPPGAPQGSFNVDGYSVRRRSGIGVVQRQGIRTHCSGQDQADRAAARQAVRKLHVDLILPRKLALRSGE